MNIPRPEHPKPQFFRKDWLNLNGTWTYSFDFGNSGFEQELHKSNGFEHKITVPFCPESSLSGVNHTDLNIHNILIDDKDKVWIIDFDKCHQASEGRWRELNLERLKRSFLKEKGKFYPLQKSV